MLERERTDLVDTSVHARIKSTASTAKNLDSLRKKFKEKNFQKIVKNLQKSVSGLVDQKLLLPVGFKENGQMIEMLLEISRDKNGKFNVVLISASEETRDLFDHKVGIKDGSQSIRREITNVSEAELLAVLPTLIELQTSPVCLSSQNTTRWRDIFLQSLLFDQSLVSVGEVTETFKKDRTIGHLTETISYVKGEYKVPDESKRFELAARLRFSLIFAKTKKG